MVRKFCLPLVCRSSQDFHSVLLPWTLVLVQPTTCIITLVKLNVIDGWGRFDGVDDSSGNLVFPQCEA